MKQKNAFSLIEVLLVTAIIAVVTAMGFSISKSGMEKAYNLYWYTGYSTLNDVTDDAIRKGKIDLDDFKFCNYYNHLKYMIKISESDPDTCNPDGTEHVTLTALNGIKYTLYQPAEDDVFIKINMSVPHAQKEGAKTNTDFILPIDESFNTGIGTDIRVYPAKAPNGAGNEYINLQGRADLLPFYIKPSSTTTGIKDFYSFKDAYCKLHGPTYSPGLDAEINCGSNTTSTATGSLRHISPRKAY